MLGRSGQGQGRIGAEWHHLVGYGEDMGKVWKGFEESNEDLGDLERILGGSMEDLKRIYRIYEEFKEDLEHLERI